MSLQTPPTDLPGLRPLTPQEQVQRATAFACLSDKGRSHMVLNQLVQTMLRLLLVLSLSALMACTPKEEAKPDPMAAGGIVGVNYTGEGIQEFSIDGAWGGSMGSYGGGGGTVCCVRYPRKWSPGLKVTVEWVSGHYDKHDKFIEKEHKKIVPIEKFTEPGEVYVLFFPKDEVRVYITNTGVGSKDFPGNPGYPGQYNPEKKK